MAVAAGAAESQAKPDRCRCIDAIGDVLDRVLLGNDAPFAVTAMVAIEPSGNLLVEGWQRQQIAGKLFDREAVERQIMVICVDDPVTPAPHDARAVGLIATGVRVPSCIQPAARQAAHQGRERPAAG